MKLLYTFIFLWCIKIADAQNVSINILTQNSGIVGNGGTVFLQVDIANTDNSVSVPQYKLRPQISVPAAIVSIPATGHSLPAGWTITSNNGSVIRLSNGTDEVPPNTTRTILIALQANATGGPSTISSNLFFSNGVAPGAASGPATPGDLTADNTSTSTVQVTIVTPVTISAFTYSITNCIPVLKWNTETEINTARFEIERKEKDMLIWKTIATVNATGNNSSTNKYNFHDNAYSPNAGLTLYRLKIIDRDGTYHYSENLPVNINCNKATVTVYPNPVRQQILNVTLTGRDKKAEVVLLSVSGQPIVQSVIAPGNNTIILPGYLSGEHILLVKHENGDTERIQVLIIKQ